jgi:two-component system chemotaxis response regulator CheY
MKVLIVEDDSMYQHILKGHMRQYQKDIQVVSWVKVDINKIKLLEHYPPDVILLDFFLRNSDFSGYEFLKLIRANNKLKEIPVIMMTSNNYKGDIKKVLKLNVNAYLIKPVVKKSLYEELDKINYNDFNNLEISKKEEKDIA